MKTLICLSALVLAPCLSLSAQTAGGEWETLLQLEGANAGDGFGYSLAVGPDMDGDGYPEMAVCSLAYKDSLGREVGQVELRSGKTGIALWAFQPIYTPDNTRIGEEVDFIPDLNGDGIADIISSSWQALDYRGKVFILSGADGSLIRVHEGVYGYASFLGERLGKGVMGIADIDSDGFGDYLYSAVRSDGFGGVELVGRIDCRSGHSGQLLWQTYGTFTSEELGETLAEGPDFNGDSVPDIISSSLHHYVALIDPTNGQVLNNYQSLTGLPFEAFGNSVASTSDLDGDLLADIAIGASNADTGLSSAAGYVVVVSSSTGMPIWQHDGGIYLGAFGHSIFNIGDLNQDEFDDIAVYEPGNAAAQLRVLSGADGRLLWDIYGWEFPNAGFGQAVAAADRTGDGIPELFVGDSAWDSLGWQYSSSYFGGVRVLSFQPFLYGETSTLSVSQPSSLSLRLDFPDTEAGKPFAVLASAAGNLTTVIRGLEIPLVVDSYFQSTVQAPPSSFRGSLDSNGDGLVSVIVPPARVAPLLGSTLYFAAITAGGGQARLSSVAVPVTVVQ